jgi:MFS family permease
VFLINLPLGLAVLALAARSIPRDRLGTRPTIDYSGIGLVSVGASALTLGLSWGGNEYAWSSMTILGLFVLAAVAFAGFIAVEARASEPMLPLRLFRNPVFSVTVVLAFIVGFAMLGALTFLPTYSQYVKGVSPTASGLRTLPLVVSLLITSMVAGTVVSRTGRYKIFPLAGCAIMGVGLFMLSRLTPESSYLTLAIDMFVLGAGIGFAMQILTIIVQNASPFADLGVATSGVGFFRTLGSSFGTAIFGTIFTSSVTGPLHSALVKAQIPPAAASTPSELHRYPAHRIAPVVQAYSDSLQTVFLWAVPVAGLGVVLALFLKQTPVRATVQSGATDLGEGFGLPETGTG